MSRRPLYLSLDQGSHGSRAMLFDATGRLHGSAEHAIKTTTPRDDWLEHQAEDILDSLRYCIREIAALNAGPIESAGLATQRSTITAWRRSTGKALSPAISWQDRRAAQSLATLDETSRHTIEHKTGLVCSPHYGASKMQWCMHNLAAVQKAAAENDLIIGPLASYLQHQLTGNPTAYVDPGNAGRTLLFNVHTEQWDDELLQLFGLSEHHLPHCVKTIYPFGDIAAGKTTVPLRLVNGDQNSAVFTDGWVKEDHIYINIGTGAFALRATSQLSPEANQTREPILQSTLYRDQTSVLYANEGTVNGAGSALSWAQEHDYIGDNFPDTDEVGDCLFINGVGGVGSPFWRTDLRSEFLGECNPISRFNAILESIVFLLTINVDAIIQQTGEVKGILISGGLSRFDTLCQKLANLTTLPVKRSNQPEATAKGTAFLLSRSPQWRQPTYEQFHPQIDHPLQARNKRWYQEMLSRLA